jgi:hypothetical protein
MAASRKARGGYDGAVDRAAPLKCALHMVGENSAAPRSMRPFAKPRLWRSPSR